MSLYARFASKGPSGFGYGSTAEEVTRGLSLDGKTILVTGCNSGLGLETMRVLALRGAHVLGTARSVEKAREACSSVTGRTTPLSCELADPKSVRACVDAVKAEGKELDAIICNAGIMALPTLERAYGYELQFFTNHIGHFILVTGLLDQLSDTARVAVVSSDAHKRSPREGIEFDNLDGAKAYGAVTNYGQSKIANILFAKELSRRFAGTKKTANAIHPGVIKTNLTRYMNPLATIAFAVMSPIALKSIEQGAATEVFVATHPSLDGVTGEYFSHCNVAQPRRISNDPQLAKKLWDVSERIAGEVGC
jgi:NAD(P)-dependent dehydrogenase (short-subunit alcohol dehydrogenase family)